MIGIDLQRLISIQLQSHVGSLLHFSLLSSLRSFSTLGIIQHRYGSNFLTLNHKFEDQPTKTAQKFLLNCSML